MKVRDSFAGAGGWDVAVRRVFGVEADGVEWWDPARATRDVAGLVTIEKDVRNVVPVPGMYDLDIASPPCQTFSAAGKGDGRRQLETVLAAIRGDRAAKAALDEKTGLVLEPLRIALAGQSPYQAWEQVPAVLPIWEVCAEVLREHGWSVWTGVLRAEQYGVPQTRRRAILMARRDGSPVFPPAPTHSRFWERTPERLDDGVLPWVSMATALGVPPDAELVSNYGTGGDPKARGRRAGAMPAATVSSKADRNVWFFDRRVVGRGGPVALRSIDFPAPTILGSGSPSIRRSDLPGSGSKITIEQALVLQSFPAGWPVQGNKGESFLQVGNAIPPLLAEAVLRALVS